MSLFPTLVVLLAFVSPLVQGESHALLVAASATYENYRHQADVARAYAVLREGGVKAENIVVFMVDDIANNPKNPLPGTLYNMPTLGSLPAKNLYPLIKDHIDYKGADVTPDNFLAILQGLPPVNCTDGCTKRTLTSTAEDNLFVYFVNHGGEGVWGFPPVPPAIFFNLMDGVKLVDALKAAYAKKMYKKLVFYVEACDASSVFEGWGNDEQDDHPLLPKDIGVYAMSATNYDTSAWATYCGAHASVAGTLIGICISDQFSSLVWADTESSSRSTKTLAQQYTATVAGMSHAAHPTPITLDGDQSFTADLISDFFGANSSGAVPTTTVAQDTRRFGVSSRDVRLNMLEWELAEAERGSTRFALDEAKRAVHHERIVRAHVYQIFAQVWASFRDGEILDVEAMPHTGASNRACRRAAMGAVERTVGGFNGYSLQFVRVLVELCETGVPTADIVGAIQRFATPQPAIQNPTHYGPPAIFKGECRPDEFDGSLVTPAINMCLPSCGPKNVRQALSPHIAPAVVRTIAPAVVRTILTLLTRLHACCFLRALSRYSGHESVPNRFPERSSSVCAQRELLAGSRGRQRQIAWCLLLGDLRDEHRVRS